MGIFDSIKQAFTGKQSGTNSKQETEKRELPDSFYIDTVEMNREQKDQFLRSNPHSPIEERMSFKGLNYYPVNKAFRYTLPLQQAETPEQLIIQTSTGDEQSFLRVGTVEFEVDGTQEKLAIYKAEYQDDLFVPFRDATSGIETYGAGRYLEPDELPDNKIMLDFNLAYNPFCAYSENYSCPLPPFENHLSTVAIRAGEKIYKKPNAAQ